LKSEKEKRKKAEVKNRLYKKKLMEMKAFQITVQNFMHNFKNGGFFTPGIASINTKTHTESE